MYLYSELQVRLGGVEVKYFLFGSRRREAQHGVPYLFPSRDVLDALRRIYTYLLFYYFVRIRSFGNNLCD